MKLYLLIYLLVNYNILSAILEGPYKICEQFNFFIKSFLQILGAAMLQYYSCWTPLKLALTIFCDWVTYHQPLSLYIGSILAVSNAETWLMDNSFYLVIFANQSFSLCCRGQIASSGHSQWTSDWSDGVCVTTLGKLTTCQIVKPNQSEIESNNCW